MFLEPKSPNSSPMKNPVVDHMSAAGKTHVRALLQLFQTLNSNSDDDIKAFQEVIIHPFAPSMTEAFQLTAKVCRQCIEARF